MENGHIEQQWVLDALHSVLPDHATEFLRDHILDPQTPFQIVGRYISSCLSQALSALGPILTPLWERAARALSDSPDAVVFAIVLAALFLVLQVVFFVQRTVLYFTRLAFRLMGWALVVGLIAAAWRRGPEATARDVVVVVSKVVGYAAVVRDIWWSEYQKYDAQTRGQKLPGYGEGRIFKE